MAYSSDDDSDGESGFGGGHSHSHDMHGHTHSHGSPRPTAPPMNWGALLTLPGIIAFVRGIGANPVKLRVVSVITLIVLGYIFFMGSETLTKSKFRINVDETFGRPRHYMHVDGVTVSPWHDVPLFTATPGVVRFVCEIPRRESAKMEIDKETKFNPLAQDLKNGQLRYYSSPSLVNYGALPQTWEDPSIEHPDLQARGDNDPVDVLEVGTRVCTVGEVYNVRILGALALIDSGELDWKIVAARTGDSYAREADLATTTNDGLLQYLDKLRVWFRDYKLADGNPPNTFAHDGKAFSASEAMQVIKETHSYWQRLVQSGDAKMWTPTSKVVPQDTSS